MAGSVNLTLKKTPALLSRSGNRKYSWNSREVSINEIHGYRENRKKVSTINIVNRVEAQFSGVYTA
jgi:hypothetical protein